MEMGLVEGYGARDPSAIAACEREGGVDGAGEGKKRSAGGMDLGRRKCEGKREVKGSWGLLCVC